MIFVRHGPSQRIIFKMGQCACLSSQCGESDIVNHDEKKINNVLLDGDLLSKGETPFDLDNIDLFVKQASKDPNLTEEPEKEISEGFYKGQWLNSKRHGRGRTERRDNCVYEGQYVNDVPNGVGIFTYGDGGIYKGQWADGLATGFGTFIKGNGFTYTGDWVKNAQQGYGVEECAETRYEGTFFNNLKEGRGIFSWKQGSVYEGEFHNNKIHGEGTYKWDDGRVYTGQWVESTMCGNGITTWPDGRRYEGQYLDNRKHGFGKFSWPNGRCYEGQWKEGHQHGEGVFLRKEGGKSKKYWWVFGTRHKTKPQELIDEEKGIAIIKNTGKDNGNNSDNESTTPPRTSNGATLSIPLKGGR